jgi:hypothetical protein
MSISIIPIELDALPCPIRVVSESQKKYANLNAVMLNSLKPMLDRVLTTYEQTGVIDPEFYKILKEMRETQKLQLEYLKFIQEMTSGAQATMEQHTVDILVALVKNDADLRKKLGEKAARMYLNSRTVMESATERPDSTTPG